MSKLKKRYVSIQERIRSHDYEYYILDDPLISDHEYDELFKELKEIESEHPEWITSESPSQRVGIKPESDFATFKHFQQMLSLANAFNEEDLKGLHDFYLEDDDIMFVSHTVYPETDSVEVLKAYSDKYEVNSDKWIMLTGVKEEIYSLARKSYFAVLTKGDGGERDFIHTENFVLMDKKQRIRGYYDGTLVNEMERLKKDIEILRLEYR